jgi:hypothetical protein
LTTCAFWCCSQRPIVIVAIRLFDNFRAFLYRVGIKGGFALTPMSVGSFMMLAAIIAASSAAVSVLTS